MSVYELEKPQGRWCTIAKPAWVARFMVPDDECRQFFWRIPAASELSEEWKPSRSRSSSRRGIHSRITFHVDASIPTLGGANRSTPHKAAGGMGGARRAACWSGSETAPSSFFPTAMWTRNVGDDELIVTEKSKRRWHRSRGYTMKKDDPSGGKSKPPRRGDPCSGTRGSRLKRGVTI